MKTSKFTLEQESVICIRYQTPMPTGDLPTAVELASEFGCSDGTIRSILKKNNVSIRTNKGRQSTRLFDKATELAACNYYWTRLSTGYYPSYDETGLAYGCTGEHIRNLLRRHGFANRTNAETRDRRPCKPINQPDTPAPLCACGCGTPTEWISKDSFWQKYVHGHYRPKKLYHDAEWLREEYIVKVRSLDEIAQQFGVNPGTIVKAMKKLGLKRRTTSETLLARGTTSGASNPAWKGGVAKWAYSSDWKRLCKQIKDRDKWTCQLCKEQRKRWGHRLHVHHIDEDKTNNHPCNLISLCSTCHAPIHGNISIRAILAAIAIANTQ